MTVDPKQYERYQSPSRGRAPKLLRIVSRRTPEPWYQANSSGPTWSRRFRGLTRPTQLVENPIGGKWCMGRI